MGNVRFGTVGYSYRDWAGICYPPGTPPRRQFNVYAQQFDVCELTQFTHQMPDLERMTAFAAQVRTDLRFFVRLHNTFTHCADVGLALTVAKHFRKAMAPLVEAGRFAGLVAAFPYAFKSTPGNREYIEQLAAALGCDEQYPLQLDFRHGSWWSVQEPLRWLSDRGFGLVCVDEPQLPGLVPPLVTATANRVLVRLHGRNSEGWWSGNAATRYDYCYSAEELEDLRHRYEALTERSAEVSFVFQNNWQAQSVHNARQFQALFAQTIARLGSEEGPAREASQSINVVRTELSPSTLALLDDSITIAVPLPSSPSLGSVAAAPHLENVPSLGASLASRLAASVPANGTSVAGAGADDDALRPPTSLPLSEVKSRVTRALSVQESLELPPRES